MLLAEVCPNLITEEEVENSKNPSTPKDDSLGPIEEVDGKWNNYIYPILLCVFPQFVLFFIGICIEMFLLVHKFENNL